MRFVPAGLAGAWILEPERHADERGSFARTFDEAVFARRGLVTHFPQHSVSFNRRRGTLRGLHLQAAPHEETKLVRCSRGAVVDVAVDLRPGSATYRAHLAVELSADNGRQLYIPQGCAHGFQTLADDTELHYLISTPYMAAAVRGYRWDDPAFGIEWPLPVTVISERDRALPCLDGT